MPGQTPRSVAAAAAVIPAPAQPLQPLPKVTKFAAQMAEVEVDPTTDGVRVLNLTTTHDTGTVLNHLTLTGQIEGGVVTGFGFALMEENPILDGKIATLTLGESKLPCIADVPPLKTVLIESPTGPTPFGGKAIAENPNVPTAAAIAPRAAPRSSPGRWEALCEAWAESLHGSQASLPFTSK